MLGKRMANFRYHTEQITLFNGIFFFTQFFVLCNFLNDFFTFSVCFSHTVPALSQSRSLLMIVQYQLRK